VIRRRHPASSSLNSKRNGAVIELPKNIDIRELAGMLRSAPRRLTIEEMDEAVRSRFKKK
jgi:hypothetical protein